MDGSQAELEQVDMQQASLPTIEWLGVERLVFACVGVPLEFPEAATEHELCEALLRSAKQESVYPLVLEASPEARARSPRHDMNLHVLVERTGDAFAIQLRLLRPTLIGERQAAEPQNFSVVAADPQAWSATMRAQFRTLLAPPPTKLGSGRGWIHPHPQR